MAETRVLLADPAGEHLRLLQAALAGHGFVVEAASDARAVLARVRVSQPAVLVIDLDDPRLDAAALVAALRADPAARGLSIAGMSEVDTQRAVAGCDLYFAKPLDPIALPETINRHLGAESARISPAPPAPVSILVVEDNPTTRKMIRVALESHGYLVLEAPDCRTALAHARTSHPSLILQDLILPDMDGLELLRQLREIPATAEVPVVCLSGFLGRLDEARATQGGFAARLIKPVDPIQLLELVRVHLERPVVVDSALGRGHSVLVIDDDPLQRRLAAYYLGAAGFQVTTASDGVEALAQARDSPPDAIISDVLMPRMDGFQLCLEVRQDARLRRVPVVLVSSHYVEEVDRVLANKVGASMLVPRSEDLGAAMRAVVEALRADEQPEPLDQGAAIREAMLGRTAAQLERQVRHNAQLGQQCLMQAAQLSVLAGVAEALATNAALNAVLGDVLASCLDTAGISKGVLYLCEGGALLPRNVIGFGPEDAAAVTAFFGGGDIVNEVLARRVVVSLPRPGAVEVEHERALLDGAGLGAALLVPVLWGDKAYGVLFLGASGNEVRGDEPVAFARVLGSQMGQAIRLGEAFERLQASEERFRAVTEALDERVVVLGRDRHVIGLYGRWTSDGQARARLMNRPIEEVLGPDEQGEHAAAHARAFAGDSVLYEWSNEVEGQARFLQTMVSPVRDAHGEVSAVVRVSRDITEQKRIQAQLMFADRMASVGMLAAGIAHEINNPLAAVTANLELAVDDCAALAAERGASAQMRDLAEAVADAAEGAERVRLIVKDLKIFSRDTARDRPTAVDVIQVMESSLRLAWNEIRHRARVVRDYAMVPPIAGNESRVGQVFLNLLVNAAQVLPQGHLDANQITVRVTTDPGGQVAVEVCDNGPGIPPDVAKKLFTPFFTTKPSGVGTGLGLSICRRIVGELGGSISVDSQPGAGATFRVLLPAAGVALPVARPEPTGVPTRRRRGNVMVIDDDVMICAAVNRALALEHDVIAVMDARLALERLRAGARFDAILCDLVMPVVTGMDFYQSLRELAPEQAERVVFFTGAVFVDDARAFLDSVPNPRLEKPFRLGELKSIINQRIGSMEVGAQPAL